MSTCRIRKRLVHLQFRRFAGCPFCNLHLSSVVQRHDEIVRAGISEVVLFHSSGEDQLFHQRALSFAVVADPDRLFYVEFGVESSARALLDPRAWPALVRGVPAKPRAVLADLHGGPTGLPADLLIASTGRVLALHYGVHAFDQWTVDDLLELARDGPG